MKGKSTFDQQDPHYVILIIYITYLKKSYVILNMQDNKQNVMQHANSISEFVMKQ